MKKIIEELRGEEETFQHFSTAFLSELSKRQMEEITSQTLPSPLSPSKRRNTDMDSNSDAKIAKTVLSQARTSNSQHEPLSTYAKQTSSSITSWRLGPLRRFKDSIEEAGE